MRTRSPSISLTRRTLLRVVAGACVVQAATVVGNSAEEPPAPDKPRATPPTGASEAGKPVNNLPRFNGRDLNGWRIADEFVFKRHGKVEWRDGVVRLDKGDPGTAIVWSGEAPPTNDYEISLDVRRLDGDDFPCGLTFPFGKSHCSLIIGGWGGSVSGLSNLDDFPAVENETTGVVEIKPNRWHSIRLRVTSRDIQAWFDRNKIVDVDPRGKRFSVWWEQEPARPLGIATWNTAAELRELRFQRLKS